MKLYPCKPHPVSIPLPFKHIHQSGFHLENCPRGQTELDFKRGGGMMVKDVMFHKRHLGGQGMLECVCVCRVSYRILSFGRGETPKFGVDVEGVYST